MCNHPEVLADQKYEPSKVRAKKVRTSRRSDQTTDWPKGLPPPIDLPPQSTELSQVRQQDPVLSEEQQKVLVDDKYGDTESTGIPGVLTHDKYADTTREKYGQKRSVLSEDQLVVLNHQKYCAPQSTDSPQVLEGHNDQMLISTGGPQVLGKGHVVPEEHPEVLDHQKYGTIKSTVNPEVLAHDQSKVLEKNSVLSEVQQEVLDNDHVVSTDLPKVLNNDTKPTHVQSEQKWLEPEKPEQERLEPEQQEQSEQKEEVPEKHSEQNQNVQVELNIDQILEPSNEPSSAQVQEPPAPVQEVVPAQPAPLQEVIHAPPAPVQEQPHVQAHQPQPEIEADMQQALDTESEVDERESSYESVFSNLPEPTAVEDLQDAKQWLIKCEKDLETIRKVKHSRLELKDAKDLVADAKKEVKKIGAKIGNQKAQTRALLKLAEQQRDKALEQAETQSKLFRNLHEKRSTTSLESMSNQIDQQKQTIEELKAALNEKDKIFASQYKRQRVDDCVDDQGLWVKFPSYHAIQQLSRDEQNKWKSRAKSIFKVHKDVVYECQYCGRFFNDKSNLTSKHIGGATISTTKCHTLKRNLLDNPQLKHVFKDKTRAKQGLERDHYGKVKDK